MGQKEASTSEFFWKLKQKKPPPTSLPTPALQAFTPLTPTRL